MDRLRRRVNDRPDNLAVLARLLLYLGNQSQVDLVDRDPAQAVVQQHVQLQERLRIQHLVDADHTVADDVAVDDDYRQDVLRVDL